MEMFFTNYVDLQAILSEGFYAVICSHPWVV